MKPNEVLELNGQSEEWQEYRRVRDASDWPTDATQIERLNDLRRIADWSDLRALERASDGSAAFKTMIRRVEARIGA